MSWKVLLLLGSAILLVFVGWGAWLLRRNVTSSLRRLAEVELSHVPALARECRTRIRERLGVELDPRGWEEAARTLDGLVLSGRLRPLFREPGYEMRYAECVGAFLGEMVAAHARAEWVADPVSPKLVVHRESGAVETHPFLFAVRHHTHGRPGELEGWVRALVA